MDGMATLTITAAELSDSGQYICNVTLGSEERSTTFNLAVRGKHKKGYIILCSFKTKYSSVEKLHM